MNNIDGKLTLRLQTERDARIDPLHATLLDFEARLVKIENQLKEKAEVEHKAKLESTSLLESFKNWLNKL